MIDETRLCSECNSENPVSYFKWTHDRYGIPWRKVCCDCAPDVQRQIFGWEFDPGAAGEALEPEDY